MSKLPLNGPASALSHARHRAAASPTSNVQNVLSRGFYRHYRVKGIYWGDKGHRDYIGIIGCVLGLYRVYRGYIGLYRGLGFRVYIGAI